MEPVRFNLFSCFVFEAGSIVFCQLRAFKWLNFDVHLPNVLSFVEEFESKVFNWQLLVLSKFAFSFGQKVYCLGIVIPSVRGWHDWGKLHGDLFGVRQRDRQHFDSFSRLDALSQSVLF